MADKAVMSWQLFKEVFPFLALLVYLFVTTMLGVLTTQRRFAVDLHNRVREAKLMRSQYLKNLDERRNSKIMEV